MGTATPAAMAATLVFFPSVGESVLVGPVGSAEFVTGPDAGDIVDFEGVGEADVRVPYCVSSLRMGASDNSYQ
jgi:hypothetical protein